MIWANAIQYRSYLCLSQRWHSFLKNNKRKVPYFKDRTSPAIIANPDSNRINHNCVSTVAKDKSLDERNQTNVDVIGVFSRACTAHLR